MPHAGKIRNQIRVSVSVFQLTEKKTSTKRKEKAPWVSENVCTPWETVTEKVVSPQFKSNFISISFNHKSFLLNLAKTSSSFHYSRGLAIIRHVKRVVKSGGSHLTWEMNSIS